MTIDEQLAKLRALTPEQRAEFKRLNDMEDLHGLDNVTILIHILEDERSFETGTGLRDDIIWPE